MRHGVLMRKVLYSGAWHADLLQLFPMSLADRSFDSDGHCVCVCLYVCVCVVFLRVFCQTAASCLRRSIARLNLPTVSRQPNYNRH